MLIAVDIGNSSISIGYFTKRSLVVQKIDTKPLKKAEEYWSNMEYFLTENHIEKNHFNGIISSVVVSHTAVFKKALKMLFNEQGSEVLIVNHNMNTGLGFKIDAPEELGTDRIADAAGAWERYKVPVAVIDFGTATTITVIDDNGNYIGGAIMPGIGLMNDMLEGGTSKLKKIPLEPPEAALGKNTTGCISSGLFYGSAGAAERILAEIEKETGYCFKVIITGGYGRMACKYLARPHDIDPNLTLEGLKVLYERNRPA